jgi:hypothetical protein
MPGSSPTGRVAVSQSTAVFLMQVFLLLGRRVLARGTLLSWAPDWREEES